MKTKLCPFSFGIAIGAAEGIYMLLFGWIAWIWGYGVGLIQLISQGFIGFAPSFSGGIFGGIWGFFDGFIFGLIAAWVYNLCTSRCKSEQNNLVSN